MPRQNMLTAAPGISDPYKSGSESKSFGLRLSGSVRLWGPEIEIVESPEFQRLDQIRQLGTAHLVFRSANHTRFEHSLGTLHEAQRIIDAVNGNPRGQRRVAAAAIRLVRLLALLHDLTHVPYSHTLEDEAHLLDRHDHNEARRDRLLVRSRIGEVLRETLANRLVDGISEYELLLQALQATEEDAHERLGNLAYVIDIVNNTVCADALDYIPRDLTACGMPVAIGDHFMNFFVVTGEDAAQTANRSRLALRLEKRGMPRPDVESEVMQLLDHRYHLVERVFFHHGKNAASAMLARAVQILGLHEVDENFDWLGDASLGLALAQPAVADILGLSLTADPDRWREGARLGQALDQRRLYKLAYLGIAEDDARRRATAIHEEFGIDPRKRLMLEDDFASGVGLKPGQVLVHIPTPRMLAKPGLVRVQLENDDVLVLRDWDAKRSQRLQALEKAHERLWRVAVYVDPEVRDKSALQLLTQEAEDEFKLPSHYVESPDWGSYFGGVFDLNAETRGWPRELRDRAVREAELAAARTIREGGEDSRGLQARIDLMDAVVRDLREQHRREALREAGQEELPLD